MNTKRSSNLELLRILAMLMIISAHLCGLGIAQQLSDVGNTSWNAAYFCQPVIYKRFFVLAMAHPSGKMGNAIFILISGYFMANKPSEAIDLTKSGKKLLCMIGYAVVLLTAASAVFRQFVRNPLTGGTITSFIDFTWFDAHSWWFPGYYFLVILIGKLFLNKWLAEADRKKHLMLVVSLLALVEFQWTVLLINNLIDRLSTLFTGVFLYALGGYIRKYDPFEKVRSWAFFAIIIGTYAIICINYCVHMLSSINAYDPNSGELFIQGNILGYGNNSIYVFMVAVSLFELFRRLPEFRSRIINYLAASTFMVFLLHCNEFCTAIWMSKDWMTPLYESPLRFCFEFAVWVIGIFIVCAVLYGGYLLLGRLLKYLKPLAVRE